MDQTERKRIILVTQGGAGDVLAHTPMVRYYRKKYPEDELIVASTYAQLWENNPNVDKVVPLNAVEEFYQDEILHKEIRFVKKHFVYDSIFDERGRGSKCLPEFICKIYDAEYDGQKLDYFVAEKEKKIAKTFLRQYRTTTKLPIVLLHCTGSIASDGNLNKSNSFKDLEIPKVVELVKRQREKILFIQIGLNGEPVVEGAIDALGMPMREAVALIPEVDSFLFIESLFAHCSNALGKTGLVVFQNTDPTFFGYSNNHNLSFSGGCADWPCNRPVGALFDLMAGYRNPKTRQKLLWECNDQLCKKMPVEDVEKALLESLERKETGLDLARKTQPVVHGPSPRNPIS